MNLNDLIETAIKYDACENSIKKIRKYKTFEEASQDKEAPLWCYWYALTVIQGRWNQGEPIILLSSTWSYFYAKHIIKGRWEEAENIIRTTDVKPLYELL